jgi:hypothetical protein
MKAAWLRLWRWICRIFKSAWIKLPIVGGWCNAPYWAFREAAKELAFVWSLSLLPLIITILIDAASSPADVTDAGFWYAVSKNVKSGEIFIYANALLAPIGFILYKHNRDEAKFPNHISFMWLLFITIPISIAIFVLQRRGIITNQGLIDRIAIGIFSVTLLMRYTSMVYDSIRTDVAGTQRKNEDALVEKMQQYSETK